MELDIKQKQTIPNATGVSTATPAVQASARIKIHVGQTENLGNTDVVISGTTDVTNEEQSTIRSEGEVRSKLEDTAKKFNLSLDEVIDLIKKMTNKSFEDLLNLEQDEYNNLTIGLDKILASCLVDNKLDNTKLEKAINDYSIATQTGWTLEGFRNRQLNVKKSTITERLAETNCFDKEKIKPFIEEALNGRDINNLNEKELKEVKRQAIEKYLSTFTTEEYNKTMEAAIEKFFEKELLSRIDENTPLAEREKIYKAQLQTFGRLLVNTENGRDRELLGSAIDKLYRTNILPAAKAGIQAMETEEAKANFARHIDFEEAVTTDSQYEVGVYMTDKDAEHLANLKYGNMNADDIKSDLPVMEEKANVFFEKYNDKLAEIDEKLKDLKNNPDLKPQDILSEEEFEIFIMRENFFKAGYSGATTGIASSINSTVVEQRDELLQAITTDIYEIGQNAGNNFYTEVMEQIAEYVKNNKDSLNLTESEFEELMDKATENLGDSKYSNVVTVTEPEKSNQNSNDTDLGFNTKEAPVNTSTQTSINNLYQNQNTETTRNEEQEVSESGSTDKTVVNPDDVIASVNAGGVEALYTIMNAKGVVTTVSEILNLPQEVANNVYCAAKNIFRTYKNMQDEFFALLTTGAINKVANITSKSTWEKVGDETQNSYAKTLITREYAKDALEQKA